MDIVPPLSVAKWNMHKDAAATASYSETFRPLIGSSERCDVVICPPFLGLEAAVGATASASFRSCAVAFSALARSRAAPIMWAPWAASERGVSIPMPAETPVLRIRLPRRSIPDKTSSVVDVVPNMFVIVLTTLFFVVRSHS
jgi:hypothetical protein